MAKLQSFPYVMNIVDKLQTFTPSNVLVNRIVYDIYCILVYIPLDMS